MKELGRRLGIAGLALLALGLAACGQEERPLKVGVILPMTGDQSTYGEESWNGIRLAKEDLEARGIRWELVLKDEKSTKQEAGNQAKLLIENEGVDVLLGSVASSNTEQIAVEARESGIPLITPASTNDTVTVKGGPFVSRICFKDSFQGEVLANFAVSRGWKKAAMVVDKAQVYSTGLAENFERVFTKSGGTVATEYYTTADTDFSNTVVNVARHEPDVIFISGYYAQGGPMIRQGKEKWKGVPVIGGDGLDSPDLVGLVGETDAEIYLSTHFAADAPDPKVREFAERYEKKFGKSPGAMAALGYDILFVLADAVKRCDPRDHEQLARAIGETKGVKCITGTIDLTTPDRTPIKDAVIVKVEGGLKYHATVPPPK
jgi:branched-chain amino acid transport system substrate-binding protein